ncbi:MAG: hypothetical protein FD178_84 [Ignavibacteria bacterium]|nr:MAG: hypothetical protein FD178_84 [Ignavibacteria bacterium]
MKPILRLRRHYLAIKIKAIQVLYIFCLLAFGTDYGQGILKVTTDKSVYSYGDMIEVKVWFTNNTDKPISIYGSSNCIARINFNDVQMVTYCTADYREFYFAPGKSKVWIWYLDPKVLGIPTVDGKQKIVGYCYPFKDSVYITAQKYRGGIVFVGLKDSVSDEEYNKLRDSLNASVIARSYNTREYEEWSISNKSIDSLVAKYKADPRLRWIQAKRDLYFAKQFETDIDYTKEVIPNIYSLSQNYPNPFNPETTIEYSIPVETRRGESLQKISLKVYDVLGREIATLVDEYKSAGNYKVTFNARHLERSREMNSGVYFYQLRAGSFIETKKLCFIK